MLSWFCPSSHERCLVCGAPRSGKSLLCRRVAYLLNRGKPRRVVLLFDPTWTGARGFGRAVFYAARPVFSDVQALVNAGRVPVITSTNPTHLSALYRAAQDVGGCTVIVDEAAYMGAGRDNRELPALRSLAVRGRHRDTCLVLAAQRRSMLSADLQGVCTSVMVGNTVGAVDRDWCRAYWGIRPPEANRVFRCYLSGKGFVTIKV